MTMPVATSYPGVYIEELPSGVRTLTGVATSITAFVGYTVRGPINRGIRVLSYSDFERWFGGLAVDSPVSYAVNHFFQNGGADVYVIRTAQGAARAGATVQDQVAGAVPAGVDVLGLEALSEGTWGNNVRVDVDYDTISPGSLFNLTVTSYIEQDGRMVPDRAETHRNLSMNSFDPGYVERIVQSGSELVSARRLAAPAGTGSTQSPDLTLADLDRLYTAPDALSRNRLAFILNGVGPIEFDLFSAAAPLNLANVTVAARLAEIAARIQAEIIARTALGSVTVTVVGNAIHVLSNVAGERSAIHFITASQSSGVGTLRLDAANGANEVDAAAAVRPARTGTLAVLPPLATWTAALGAIGANGAVNVNVFRGNDVAALNPAPITLNVWGAGTGTTPVALPTTEATLLAALRAAFARNTNPLLRGTTVTLVAGALRVLLGPDEPNHWIQVVDAGGADTTATDLGFTVANAENLSRYALGSDVVRFARSAFLVGNNGTPPAAAGIVGLQAAKTGMYALEDVDLFNILCIPGLDRLNAVAVQAEAIAYCERRRAFFIIDIPDDVDTLAEANTWLGADALTLRSRNAAAYFPRIRRPDPLASNVVRDFASSGTIAGLYARTDGERGVWKAPAGTSALLVGATGLDVTLNDRENGILNPLGLNCLRTFPVYGTVCWGARTMRGADAMADEYKYVPIRRLALFLEESLYRGTQWVVFEPNDEPLWAQIRLNVGAFMHNLFSQGAFQGKTPREAYFVRCDGETTTQNDRDLGRVNILVGFAPLKPAEFVIIKIQQIAGAIQT
jgi:uncharacterized protein